ncbi:hypothetical protein GDO78_004143 [Eleutherodactylus coqui]|uniref:Signal recognition particle subunit SRP68 n=1 Tax=Eleutherodactylus coqui TaxID=57060 RepID=A0A8J6EQG1_ELECQ|nr:hypothetical protein GDO78_004143 [Eleutherodactylus coqui]
MSAERQLGTAMEENKENERPAAGGKSAVLGDTLGLEILQIIKESQQQHGMRHGDFQRYRGYCSRRLRRLRKTLGFKMGNRHKFTGKKVTVDMLSDNRYLLLILMDAERAWSYAMQLKMEANTEPRKRFHLTSRLRKAVKHGEKLERLCESDRVDAKTKLEAQAYSAYLNGMLQFEQQQWQAAMKAFNKCNWFSRVCRKKRFLIACYEQYLLQNHGGDAECGLGSAEDDEAKERLFESVLSECRDAIQSVREELKAEQRQRDAVMDGEMGKVSTLQYLHSYLSYIKLSTAIQRNESMASALQKALLRQPQTEEDGKRTARPQDLIRLYDIILQNLAELTQLPGLEDDQSFQKEIVLKTLVYKAYRCFFIAQSYVLVKKWSEALVLYDRVLKYAKEVQAQTGNKKSNIKELPDVQELIKQVNAEKYSLQAAAILDTTVNTEEVSPYQAKENKVSLRAFLDVPIYHLNERMASSFAQQSVYTGSYIVGSFKREIMQDH